MKISQPVKLAGIIIALIVLYFMIRSLFAGEAEQVEAAANPDFTVVTEIISPQDWRDEVTIRGRTKAERKVIVRAETSGNIIATPTKIGSFVSKGEVLCRLSVDARRAQLAEANASLAKAELDYNAAVKLGEDGFRSETGVAQAKAVRDQARALVERARLELEKTEINAPFDGVYDERHAEVGDYLKVGDPCATVIQRSPFLIVGAVSERDVNKIAIGDRGVATLATGETIEGTVRFVAKSADPATRTFDVELEVPNDDGNLRDGVTAEFTVFARERSAHRVPRSALILNDNGDLGIRSLNGENIVQFEPVRMLGETPSGIWVSGLEAQVKLITSGQGFVSTGQKVQSVDAAERQS
ncbi:efflux RND transporter periplasmic adaptor subunit [Hyphococcus formosus]|uniref:efflux RND transporter periplasmic adaptor subunit n=1 Tax=Hyphococcus formosus TaxID=3143534 RepID=UPI00398AB7DB